MKTLYLECNMGAAGDMLSASLLELIEDREAFVEQMNRLGLEGVRIEALPSMKCGILGTHLRVLVEGEEEESLDVHEHTHDHHHEHEHGHHHHHHTSLKEIDTVVRNLKLSDHVKENVIAVYRLIAQAEGHAHGVEVDQIHFHEVGNKDAIMDIVMACSLIERIQPDRILASPVAVGSGSVHCAHGILPVPAPATEYLLRNVPYYSGAMKGELCTPTGAALLKHFVSEFIPMPVMRVEKTGIGMGKKDFEQANCVRAFLGCTEGGLQDRIVELSCNLDDMTGEEIGFAMDLLLEAGARDVYTEPISMKKNRPAVKLNVLTSQEKKETMVSLLFAHTSTLGIRENLMNRYVLERREEEVNTPLGPVTKKLAEGYGVSREKVEYEDLRRLAKENAMSISEVKRAIL